MKNQQADFVGLFSIDNFKPIGCLDAPFKDSFTCDTNEDGTPKYVIKNLMMKNNASERYGHKKAPTTMLTMWKTFCEKN